MRLPKPGLPKSLRPLRHPPRRARARLFRRFRPRLRLRLDGLGAAQQVLAAVEAKLAQAEVALADTHAELARARLAS